MRQRRIKNRSLYLQPCSNYIYKGRGEAEILKPFALAEDLGSLYHEEDFVSSKLMPGISKDKPCFLEIGSGKGQFITSLAKENPDKFYLACEGGLNINLRILQKANALKLDNLLVITEYILKASDWFNENSLDGIYLNFCDPWPKDRHANRRLTHRALLEEYKKVSKPGACLEFKTDNDDLFTWSLEEFKAAGLKEIELSRDLHRSEYNEKNIPTEYEEKFASTGKTINYIKLQLR